MARKRHAYILLALTAADDGFPLPVRVRRLLKYALRALGMKSLYVDWGGIPTPTASSGERTPGEAAQGPSTKETRL
jgi:hypothetical protein